MMTHLLANVFHQENQFDPCTASCLQENVSGVNAGKGCVQEDSNPVKGRPKRRGDKNMGGLLTIQGPKSCG